VQIKGTVRISERLGRDIELEVSVGDGHLIVVTDSSKAVAERDDVVLSIDVPQIHVFAGGDPGQDTARLGSAQQISPVTKEVEQ
jgi:ABC-type sugar transport system ATPase subunit